MGLCVAPTEQMTSVDQTFITTNSRPIYTPFITTYGDVFYISRKVVLNSKEINVQKQMCSPLSNEKYITLPHSHLRTSTSSSMCISKGREDTAYA